MLSYFDDYFHLLFALKSFLTFRVNKYGENRRKSGETLDNTDFRLQSAQTSRFYKILSHWLIYHWDNSRIYFTNSQFKELRAVGNILRHNCNIPSSRDVSFFEDPFPSAIA